MHGEMSAINRFSTLTAIAAGMIVTAAAFIFFALLGLSGVPQVNLDGQLHVQVIRAGESQGMPDSPSHPATGLFRS